MEDKPSTWKRVRCEAEALWKGDISSLEGLSIRNARLAFRDEPTGLFIISPDTNFSLETTRDGLNTTVESAIEISGVPTRVTARVALRDDGMPRRGTVEVEGLSVPALSKNNPELAYLQPYEIVSNVQADFELDESGALTATKFHLDGSGAIANAAVKTPLRMDKFDVAGSYDGVQDRVVLESIALQGKPIAGKATASFALTKKDGAFATAAGEITAENVKLTFPGFLRQDLTLSKVALKADYDKASRRLSIERATVDAAAIAAEASGAVTFADGASPALALSGTMQPITVSDLLEHWPLGVGEGAEAWIRSQVQGAMIGPVRVEANFPVGTLDKDVLPENAPGGDRELLPLAT